MSIEHDQLALSEVRRIALLIQALYLKPLAVECVPSPGDLDQLDIVAVRQASSMLDMALDQRN